MDTVTISLEVPPELARQLTPLRDRLPEIIELGLRQWEVKAREEVETNCITLKQQVLAALHSTGIVTMPEPTTVSQDSMRHTPIKAGGPPASEMIIKERRDRW